MPRTKNKTVSFLIFRLIVMVFIFQVIQSS